MRLEFPTPAPDVATPPALQMSGTAPETRTNCPRSGIFQSDNRWRIPAPVALHKNGTHPPRTPPRLRSTPRSKSMLRESKFYVAGGERHLDPTQSRSAP